MIDIFTAAAPLVGRQEADLVIVGTGPGGSAVARAATERGLSVLLLEEGPPPRFRPSFAHTARYHMQEAATMVANGPVPFPVTAGRGVGGSSLINSAICFRTPPEVLRHWAEILQDPRYEPDAVAPLFDEIEARIQVVPVTEDIAGENNLVVARGVAKLGLGGGLLRRNTPGCVGCGICNFGCPSGGKASMDRTLLLDARERGARVQSDARVVSILREGDRVVGVVASIRDPDTGVPVGMIEARGRAVVLSAGAIGTARLLWSDGIAKRLGPVGDQLFLHPGTGVIGRCDFDVHMWRGATQGAYVLDTENPHVLPHTFNAPPDVFVVQSGRVGADAKALLAELNRVCGLGVMVSDHGHGSVRATDGGRAWIHYEFRDEDVAILKRGLVLAARVELAGGAREVSATAFGVGWHRDVESFAKQIEEMPLSAFYLYSAHPMSTCSMGRNPATSVVDARGHAHRAPGLYIADASVFPSSLGVNPQLTTMVVATLLGRGIAEDLG
jgi:choline dehydrogenase-like flavoprotein